MKIGILSGTARAALGRSRPIGRTDAGRRQQALRGRINMALDCRVSAAVRHDLIGADASNARAAACTSIATVRDPAHALRMERIPLTEALELGADAWDRALAYATCPFAGWAWHRAWADTAAEEEVGCTETVLLHRDNELVGILPLARRATLFRRQSVPSVTWATGELGCPDGYELPSLDQPAVHNLAATLANVEWDILKLDNLHPDTPGAASLASVFERAGYSVRTDERNVCPYLELPDSWEACLGELTASRRGAVRYRDRKLRRAHRVSFTDYSPDRLEEGWSWLLRLHSQRWEGGGVFQDEMTRRFHRRLISHLAARDSLWLTSLDVDGVPRAIAYCFAHRNAIYHYQTGRDLDWNRWSVGSVLTARLIRRAIEQGYERYEFLRGEEEYKLSWTSTSRTTWRMVVFRPNWRGRLLAALDWTARVTAGVR